MTPFDNWTNNKGARSSSGHRLGTCQKCRKENVAIVNLKKWVCATCNKQQSPGRSGQSRDEKEQITCAKILIKTYKRLGLSEEDIAEELNGERLVAVIDEPIRQFLLQEAAADNSLMRRIAHKESSVDLNHNESTESVDANEDESTDFVDTNEDESTKTLRSRNGIVDANENESTEPVDPNQNESTKQTPASRFNGTEVTPEGNAEMDKLFDEVAKDDEYVAAFLGRKKVS